MSKEISIDWWKIYKNILMQNLFDPLYRNEVLTCYGTVKPRPEAHMDMILF